MLDKKIFLASVLCASSLFANIPNDTSKTTNTNNVASNTKSTDGFTLDDNKKLKTGKEADNIILTASSGEKTITEQKMGAVRDDRFDKLYGREILLNWTRFFNNQNPRNREITASSKQMVVPVVEQNATTNNTPQTTTVDTITVKGYCFITDTINIAKQPGSLRTNCQTNVGPITLFANLVTVNEKATLAADPRYIEKNGMRYQVKSSIVTNEAKTSYNIATFVNDRKLAEVGWGATSVSMEEIKTATNEYLQALEDSKVNEEVNYIPVSDGTSTGTVSQGVKTTNVEKPDPLDYLIKGGVNVLASAVKETANIFRADLPYLYEIRGGSKIWIDMTVNKKGEYVK